VPVTQDTEIEALLSRLTGEIRRNSNDSLVGLYVYGSLVSGDFDKDRSDIDLLAVVDSNVDGDTFDRLDGIHARFVADHPAWEDRIEVAYVPAPALWNFRTRTDQIAVISPGEPFHLKTAASRPEPWATLVFALELPLHPTSCGRYTLELHVRFASWTVGSLDLLSHHK
jgi:predicted nucleotidyltransferase